MQAMLGGVLSPCQWLRWVRILTLFIEMSVLAFFILLFEFGLFLKT
jgi:hypothetical protein